MGRQLNAQTRQTMERHSEDESRIIEALEGVVRAPMERGTGTNLAHCVPNAAVFDRAAPSVSVRSAHYDAARRRDRSLLHTSMLGNGVGRRRHCSPRPNSLV
jgi:hypothetical protein